MAKQETAKLYDVSYSERKGTAEPLTAWLEPVEVIMEFDHHDVFFFVHHNKDTKKYIASEFSTGLAIAEGRSPITAQANAITLVSQKGKDMPAIIMRGLDHNKKFGLVPRQLQTTTNIPMQLNALQRKIARAVNKLIEGGIFPTVQQVADEAVTLPIDVVKTMCRKLVSMGVVAVKDIGGAAGVDADTFMLGSQYTDASAAEPATAAPQSNFAPNPKSNGTNIDKPTNNKNKMKTNANNKGAAVETVAETETAPTGAHGQHSIAIAPEDVIIDKGYNIREELTGIEELAQSLLESKKMTNPIKVREDEKGKYHLTAGHRRMAALMSLNKADRLKHFATITAIVDDHDDKELHLELLTSNDGMPLTMIERGKLFLRLTEKDGLNMSTSLIAKRTGVTPQAIRDAMLIAEQPEKLLKLIREGKATATAVLVLLRKKVEGEPMSVEDIIKAIKEASEDPTGKGKLGVASAKKAGSDEDDEEEEDGEEEDGEGDGAEKGRIGVKRKVEFALNLMVVTDDDVKYSEKHMRKVFASMLDPYATLEKLEKMLDIAGKQKPITPASKKTGVKGRKATADA